MLHLVLPSVHFFQPPFALANTIQYKSRVTESSACRFIAKRRHKRRSTMVSVSGWAVRDFLRNYVLLQVISVDVFIPQNR